VPAPSTRNIIPLLSAASAQSVGAGGVASAQSFGTIRTLQAVNVTGVSSAQAFGAVGSPQTVQVAGVYPPGYVQTIVGTFLLGQRNVGGSVAAQFGAVTAINASVSISIGGVSSAQAFGTVTIRTATAKPVGGVPSAQAFGVPLIKVFQGVNVAGLGSAQAFGTVRVAQRVTVPGVYPPGFNPILNTFLCGQRTIGSSQFGQITFRTAVIFPIGVGVPSAQAFGTPKFSLIAKVGGVGSAGQFGTVRIRGTAVVGGVPSAQAFGAVHIVAGPVSIHVGGIPSAQAFGVPLVFIVWVRPEDCTDLVLAAATCTDLSLNEAVPLSLDLEPAGCS
jgi:hypothetical protein